MSNNKEGEPSSAGNDDPGLLGPPGGSQGESGPRRPDEELQVPFGGGTPIPRLHRNEKGEIEFDLVLDDGERWYMVLSPMVGMSAEDVAQAVLIVRAALNDFSSRRRRHLGVWRGSPE